MVLLVSAKWISYMHTYTPSAMYFKGSCSGSKWWNPFLPPKKICLHQGPESVSVMLLTKSLCRCCYCKSLETRRSSWIIWVALNPMTNVLAGGTENTLTHSRGSGPHPPYSFCLLADWCSPLCPSMVSHAPSLGICGNNKLSFQWQSSLALLALSYLNNYVVV